MRSGKLPGGGHETYPVVATGAVDDKPPDSPPTPTATASAFYHTEVADEFEGRGLATILVGEALEATRGDGLRIVPVCT